MAISTRFPTANEIETTGWTNPNNAHADEGTDATAAPGKNAVIGTRWFAFGFDGAIPTGSTIDAVKIIYEYFVDTNKSIATMRTRARISSVDEEDHDNTSEPLSATIITVDITADRAWTRADLLDAAFKVTGEAQRGNSNNAVTFSLDYIKVEVTYTAPQNQDVNVTGVAGTGAVGTVSVRTDVSPTPTGLGLTGYVGTVTVSITVPATTMGLYICGAIGIPLAAVMKTSKT